MEHDHFDNGDNVEVPSTYRGRLACGSLGEALEVGGNLMAEACHGLSVEGGWWSGPDADHPLVVPTKLALIHSEISEGLEGHRKNRADEHLPHHSSLAVELADAVIRIGDLAGRLGIPLGTVIKEKLAYNAVRSDHTAAERAKASGKKF
jgi:hypothetical protein